NERYLSQYDLRKTALNNIEKAFLDIEFCFVAIINDKIVGIIRGSKFRQGTLYVDSKYQRKGIATKLTKKFESEVRKQGSHELKLIASLYSVPFYLSIGYKKTTGMRNRQGIKVQPMKKIFK
ncbi:MAG: GNAT family N-acetyltransferase, partial [Candidatus Moranbacteria bacterium]|nr:GNAT family N-acetyltransferase [Candidatus Moranbacteria bacterium]